MRSGSVPLALQRPVRERAANRCEYCRVSQHGQEATFHVDHVRPRRDDGETALENLALACVSCSLRKGARTTAPDPQTARAVDLFNPRTQAWDEHFRVADDFTIVGRTPVGWASLQLLRMNRILAIEIRREEALRDSL